jgi:hypothetical protein
LGLLPAANQATVSLPGAVEFEATPGDTAELTLDGGEGGTRVLKGRVHEVRRTISLIDVVLVDAAADLAALRPAVTYQRQAGRDVVSGLASAAGVDVGGIELDLGLAAYVAHQRRTAAEHVAAVARLAGAIAHVDGDGALQVSRRPSAQPTTALLYGREIVAYETAALPAPTQQHLAIGSGPAGTPEAPDALRPSLGHLPDNAQTPGKQALWHAQPLLRAPRVALAGSQALDAENAAAATRLRATCFLLPALRPGTVVEVQSLPDGLSSGPWLVTRVAHALVPGEAGRTIFEADSAGSGGASLLGALGSLL